MLDGYPRTFKISWVYLLHALNSIKNLKEEILLSRFQEVRFHESVMTNQNANWFRELCKWQVTEQLEDCRDQNCRMFKAIREQKN